MRRSDPLIVGGGPAGSAAAITLARSGAKPLIIERQQETGDALCGGFLSWRTLETLGRLGIANPGGHRVTALRLLAGPARAEARLPRAAIGISRRALDTQLLAEAAKAGAKIERGLAVRALDDESGLHLSDGAVLRADSLFLATGKHDLRGVARARAAADPTLGLRLRMAAHPSLTRLVGESIELHLFERGYCGLALQEDGSANLCMAVKKSKLTEAGGQPEALLQTLATDHPALAERLGHADHQAFDAIGAVPYGWQTWETRSGLFRLGDQAAVIPSLAGEGNGIALASGIMAAQAWLADGPEAACAYQSRLARAAHRPVSLATRLWQLAERPTTALWGTRLIALLPFVAARLAAQTRIDT